MIVTMAALAALSSGPREPYSVARITGYGEYFDGSRLVGHGSRQRYDGGAVGMEVEAVRIPRDLGLEARLQIGGMFSTGRDRARRVVGLELGAAAALFHLGSFSMAAAVGLGIHGGRHEFVEIVRVYPYLGLRNRVWFSDATSLHVNAYYLPVSSSGYRDMELRGEVALGVGWFIAGARGSWIAYRGGDPRRTYGELGLAAFVGAAFF